jgi:DNA topoisomerase-1
MPPEYTPTPGFTLKGKKVGALCEEMFDKLSAYSTTDYWKSPIFQKNAWASWSRTLPKDLQSLKMSDFSQEMADRKKIQEAKKEAKAARSKDEKEFEKIQRDQLKQKYGFATVDGKRVPIGGYMVEAPNFIIGRGSANFTGCWKSRVQPSEITVNIVGDPQKKKELEAKGFKVVSKSDVMWLMTYRMRLVNSDYQPIKKVNFGAGSEFVHENEEHKYDKSEVLMRSWDSMKAKIFDSITSDDIRVSQAGTCAYLMMVTGQRIGGDGQKSGAGTVGMSTIQVRHVKVSGNQVSFNFLAKDSVPYKNTIEVEDYVADHLREFLKGKGPTDKVFDRTSGADVNAMMKDVVPDVSPKTFRTANAALELLQYLRAHPVDPTWSDSKKKQVLVLGNAIVAKKLNHQKNVSKSQGDQEARAKERIDKAKETLELRKNKGEEQLLKIKQQLKTAKELWTGDKLKAKISDLKEKEERIAELIRKSEERVETSTAQLQIKRGTAELALGTSLSSYVSPKIIYSWCKDVGLPPSKVYSKSLEQKQMWAEDTPPEYWREG